MSEPTIGLEQLRFQMATLKEDQRKTSEKSLQILGAMKVVEFLIKELEAKDNSGSEEVNINGTK